MRWMWANHAVKSGHFTQCRYVPHTPYIPLTVSFITPKQNNKQQIKNTMFMMNEFLCFLLILEIRTYQGLDHCTEGKRSND
jgi:hypothetical protein